MLKVLGELAKDPGKLAKVLFSMSKDLGQRSKDLLSGSRVVWVGNDALRLESKNLFVEPERLLGKATARSRSPSSPLTYLIGKGSISSDGKESIGRRM